MQSRPRVSVVVPIYNNGSAMVAEFHAALQATLDDLGEPSEIIYVDDGSRDDSLDALLAAERADSRVRVLELAANFGQHAAFSAGFDHARGEFIVSIDGDLQVDPGDIPRMLAPLREGYDLVSGVRVGRQDPFGRRLASWLVTRLTRTMLGVHLRDVGCPLNAFRADVARSLSSFGEFRRFLKPLAVSVARRVTEVEVSHRERPIRGARSSYTAGKLLRVFMDFFVNSVGQVFAWLFVWSSVVFVLALVLAVVGLVGMAAGRAWLGMILGGVGIAMLALLATLVGLAGDYVQRTYRQSSGRPFYLVRQVHESGDAGLPP